MMTTNGAERLWLDDGFLVAGVRVDPVDRTIERQGTLETLSEKSLQVLLCLAHRAPAVVTREQLLERVWAEAFVSEGVLSTAVWELRSKLGSLSGNDSIIETVRGRGYRLLVEPAALEGGIRAGAPLPETTDREASADPSGSPLPVRRRAVGGVLAASILAALALLAAKSWSGSAPAGDADESLRQIALDAHAHGEATLRKGVPIPQALDWFRLSARIDPSFVPAQAAVSRYTLYRGLRSAEEITEARRAVEMMDRAEPGSPEVSLARARIALLVDGDLALAESLVIEVLRDHPLHAEAHQRLSWIRAVQGRSEEGTQLALRAAELHETSSRRVLGALHVLYLNGAFEEVILLAEGWAPDPSHNFSDGLVLSGLSSLHLGDVAAATAVANLLAERRSPTWKGAWGYLLAQLGRRAEAQALVEHLSSETPTNHYEVARAHIGLEECGAAREALQEAVYNRPRNRLRSRIDPMLEPLRSESSFCGPTPIDAPAPIDTPAPVATLALGD